MEFLIGLPVGDRVAGRLFAQTPNINRILVSLPAVTAISVVP